MWAEGSHSVEQAVPKQQKKHDRLGILDDRLPSFEEIENANALRSILAAEVRPDAPIQLEIARSDGAHGKVTLMPALADALLELLRHVGQGKMVTMVPVDAKLTTQKAADLLNISRPHLIKLIDRGELPHEMVGRHRRLRAEDVLAYKSQRDEERSQALAKLAELDADLI